ncbi:hypothetical protein C8R45DRAFT_1167463 [Mycena sanguinolenta]|nr:hypothetical protein C8R45DRAFT_1167463 [Mycena sanguinolenta]
MTEKMVDYVLDELEGYAKIADNERGIERGCYDAIWYSDRAISTNLNERLKTTVGALENIPEAEKDWHPGSNGQVLDLIHPSLYCIVYGRTEAYLPDQSRIPGNLLPVAVPTFNEPAVKWNDVKVVNRSISSKFCWLPSDFSVDADGSVKLLSLYINNLCPTQHEPLYGIVEEILAGFIPMFDRVLGDIDSENPLTERSGRLTWSYCVWGDSAQEYEESDEDWTEWYDSQKHLPEARAYDEQLEDSLSAVTLRGRTIQCIIKLASIHLTPENPKYAGGSWHVEGMANERIVASGIYSYDEENITRSKLAFRVATSEPHHLSDNDHDCAMTQYGFSNYDNLVQEIGKMVTKEGRMLAWPNDFQHCVSSFELADPFKPGHRKILAIFLVDPTIARISSATDVPPQQTEWACDTLQQLSRDNRSRLARLPQELLDAIKKEIQSVGMSSREAEEYRLELMEERTMFVAHHSEVVYGVQFNMCEH